MRTLLAATALAATAGAACAQSSVTLFGTVDMTLAFGRGSMANKNQLSNSGYASSAIGFRGAEDLGGGLSASFWLEAAVAPDDGQGGASNQNNQTPTGTVVAGRQGLVFNRRSTVSLASGWGELRLGRDYVPHYWNHVVFDPFRNKGIGTSQTIGSTLAGVTSTRASNTIGYFLPKGLGGFHGQAQHFLGENPSGTPNSGDGKGTSMRLGYEAGNWQTAVGFGRVQAATKDITTANIGAGYDFGDITVMGSYDRDRVQDGATGKGWLLGAEYTLGAGQLRAAYSTYQTNAATNPRSTRVAVGYAYGLSKRTTLYTTAAQIRNRGTAAASLNGSVTGAGRNSTGLDLGISHRF